MSPRTSFGLSVLGLLSAAGSACAQATTNPAPASPPAVAARPAPREGPSRAGWWNDRVFYEVFVRSFQDSNGDGIGDIRGLISRLDYLNDGDPKTSTDLGITGLWLMPINPSPSYHGYDITDYYNVNPQYGTLDDFRTLITECHKRNINVILDLVLNHCSSKHPWFSGTALPGGVPDVSHHDWFIWSDQDPGWKGPWNQKVWHKRSFGEKSEWYYGLFSHNMPDLNFRNPAVNAEMLRIVDFWIDKEHNIGADGYRLDAIRHLVEDGQVQENTPETHDWLRTFHARCRKANPNSMSIGEVWTSSDIASTYVGDQLDLTFEFSLAAATVEAARTGKAKPLIEAQAKVLRCYPPNQYGSFLTNHDQTRVLTQLKNDDGAMRSAAALLLLGPGVPFIYYGEELGMTGDKPDENLRRPMRWNDSPLAGFTTAEKPWEPMGAEASAVNAAAESADDDSLLSWYRKLIGFRAWMPVIASGAFVPLECSDAGVYAFIRDSGPTSELGKARQLVIVMINLTDRTIESPTLSATASPFRGKCDMSWNHFRPNRGSMTSFQAAADTGAFDRYTPAPQIGPRAVQVFNRVWLR
jgi:glycosidase